MRGVYIKSIIQNSHVVASSTILNRVNRNQNLIINVVVYSPHASNNYLKFMKLYHGHYWADFEYQYEIKMTEKLLLIVNWLP